MPLVKSVLKIGIQEIIDTQYSGFVEFPPTVPDAAERWSEAIDKYAKLVLPVSVSSNTAKLAAKGQLLTVPTLGVQAFVNALVAYATALAVGMAPTFTGVPPPTPPVIAPILAAGFAGADSVTIAELLSSTIHIWFKTGTAINNTSGVTITWN